MIKDYLVQLRNKLFGVNAVVDKMTEELKKLKTELSFKFSVLSGDIGCPITRFYGELKIVFRIFRISTISKENARR
jgi:hypothetical protein